MQHAMRTEREKGRVRLVPTNARDEYAAKLFFHFTAQF